MTAFSAPFNHQCPYHPCPSYNIFYFPLYFFLPQSSLLDLSPAYPSSIFFLKFQICFSFFFPVTYLSYFSSFSCLLFKCPLFLSHCYIDMLSFRRKAPSILLIPDVTRRPSLTPFQNVQVKMTKKITYCIFFVFSLQTSDFFLLFEEALELD